MTELKNFFVNFLETQPKSKALIKAFENYCMEHSLFGQTETKRCLYVFKKGKNMNKQCSSLVKGSEQFCGKHRSTRPVSEKEFQYDLKTIEEDAVNIFIDTAIDEDLPTEEEEELSQEVLEEIDDDLPTDEEEFSEDDNE